LATTPIAVEGPGAGTRLRSGLRAVWEPVEGKIGLAILLVFLVVIAFGPLLAPYPPTEIGAGPPGSGPSPDHWLGTDTLGRDVFSRVLHGARSLIALPLAATCLAYAVGGLVGMLVGYVRGTTDAIVGRAIDLLLSLPPLLIILVVLTSSEGSTALIVIAVALVSAPRVARILRGATQGVVANEFVQAAQARGERALPIVVREVLPNILPTVFVDFALRLTYLIIFVASLNFLGLGLQPPSSNWAVMVAESRSTIATAPVATLAPALAIGLVSVSISLIADAVTQRLGLENRGEFLR